MAQWFNRRGANLATVARETGYPVVEVPNWSTHGHAGMANHVGGITIHHTAGPEPERTASNYPSLGVVRNGRPGLPGPLAHYGIGFNGTIYVIAAGLAYHAGSGGWRGLVGNSTVIGIEAEDSGDGDWQAAQLDVYPRLCAALCRFLGIGAGMVHGHKEWTPRKIDPAGINMVSFRRTVQSYLDRPHLIRRGGAAPGRTEPAPIVPPGDAMTEIPFNEGKRSSKSFLNTYSGNNRLIAAAAHGGEKMGNINVEWVKLYNGDGKPFTPKGWKTTRGKLGDGNPWVGEIDPAWGVVSGEVVYTYASANGKYHIGEIGFRKA